MKLLKANYWVTIFRKAVSLSVLLGFIFIQFHSYAHVDIDALLKSSKELVEHTGLTFSTHDSGHEKAADCPECVLTKSLHLEVTLPIAFFQNSASYVLDLQSKQETIKTTHHHFQLRAPPSITA